MWGDVSGRNKTIPNKQHRNMVAKKQKIALQAHLKRSTPPMTGPTLGGRVERKGHESEYPLRSEGVNKSPTTPYVAAYGLDMPALCAIRRKKRRPKEVSLASPMSAATYTARLTTNTRRRHMVSAAGATTDGKTPDTIRYAVTVRSFLSIDSSRSAAMEGMTGK